MADRTDKPAQDPALGRTSDSRRPDPNADRSQVDTHDEGDAERPVASRPRGKTEDPDRTL